MSPNVMVDVALREHFIQEHRTATGNTTSFIRWAEAVPEPKAGIMDWVRFPFQPELYSDEVALARDVAVRKATQIGISAWALRWLLYHVDMWAKTGIYIFPKRKQMYDFADARVKAVIINSPYLLRRIPRGSVANKGLRQVGAGWSYWRGSESKADLDSVDADVMVMDEYDTLRQENIPDAERRITANKKGLIRRVGVPSYPGFGIDRMFQRGDQRYWHIRCDACGDRQPLTYEHNVHEGQRDDADSYPDAMIVCRGKDCRKPLDLSEGEWVPKHPDRANRSYTISRLIVPETNLAQIVEAHQQTKPYEVQVHMNKDLGLAYAPSEGRLSDEALEAASREELKSQALPMRTDNLRTAGIDVASTRQLNVRVSEWLGPDVKKAIYIGTADDFDEVFDILDRYSVNMATVDHLPENRLARHLAERLPGRVYLARFTPSVDNAFVPNADMRTVAVNRTMAIDATFDMIRQQRNLLPAIRPEGYDAEMQALVRMKDEDEVGRVKVYYEGSGDYDYAMAEVYDMLAKEVWLWQTEGESAIEGTTDRFEDLYDVERSQLDAGTVDTGGLESYDPGFD